MVCALFFIIIKQPMIVFDSDTINTIQSFQASQREDSYEETIRDLTQRLKDVSFSYLLKKNQKLEL